MPSHRPSTGRPEPGEYADYAHSDIDLVEGDDAVEALAAQEAEVVGWFEALGEERVRGLTYAPGKWTAKEVLGHLIDDERIFVTRALGVARRDPQPRPGFDENLYVRTAGFEARTLADLLDEYRAVRRSTLAFFAGLPAEAWLHTGEVNGYPASVRGLAFHVAGHELHHLQVLRERYRPE